MNDDPLNVFLLVVLYLLIDDPLKAEASLYHIDTEEDREKKNSVTRAYFVGGYYRSQLAGYYYIHNFFSF